MTAAGQARTVELSPTEEEILHDAEQLLTKRCMERQGFSFWTKPLHPVPDERVFPFAVDDVRWAREHGYGSDIAREYDKIDRADPNQRYWKSLSPQRRKAAVVALDGVGRDGVRIELPDGSTMSRSDNGCVAEAQRHLYLDFAGWARAWVLSGHFSAGRNTLVFRDPAYREGRADLDRCLRDHGFDDRTLSGLRGGDGRPGGSGDGRPGGSGDGRPGDSGRRRMEIRAAVTEAECAESTGFSALFRRLEQKYTTQIRSQHRDVFDTRLRLKRAALPRARGVLGADGSDGPRH